MPRGITAQQCCRAHVTLSIRGRAPRFWRPPWPGGPRFGRRRPRRRRPPGGVERRRPGLPRCGHPQRRGARGTRRHRRGGRRPTAEPPAPLFLLRHDRPRPHSDRRHTSRLPSGARSTQHLPCQLDGRGYGADRSGFDQGDGRIASPYLPVNCFRCGAEIPGAARFCASCGTLALDPHDATVVIETEDSEALFHRVRMVLEGEFDVERELARGGMGVIFKATEVRLLRSVALKVLPPELGVNVRSAERFKREARMVAELDHPNIIPVYRVGQLGGIFLIAMKFIEGRSLGLILDTQGALPVPVTLHVLRGATRALAYAHDRSIVHRDIKGGNILVEQDGRVMGSDFGVALRASDVNLTADGTVIGTPPFMSPEQCAGRRTGPQSDQDSLGIVGFQMLCGAVPFHADTIAGVMQHHFFTPAPDVRQARDDVPPALADVLNRTLQKDPSARYPATRDMLAALEAIPFSESDRRESEQVLRQLVQGTVMPRVSARALPPLPDRPTMPPAAAELRKRRPPRRAGVPP